MSRIITLTLNPALDVSTDLPEVLPDRKLRCAPPRSDAGGGGVNVARAIAFLGGTAVAAVALGGANGEKVRGFLREEGIEVIDLGNAPETRENLSVICRATGRQYRFLMPGAPWQPKDLDTAMGILRESLGPGDLVVPSGSLPPGISGVSLADATAALSAEGLRVVLDTSGDALRAAAHMRGSAALELLRMDHAEAESLTGRALPSLEDVASVARDLTVSGAARHVVVAKGAEGSVLSTAGGSTWHVRPPKVAVISKTGAGDSFVAGYVLGLSNGKSALEACVLGVGAACSAVTTPDTDLCKRSDAESYAAAATVTELH